MMIQIETSLEDEHLNGWNKVKIISLFEGSVIKINHDEYRYKVVTENGIATVALFKIYEDALTFKNANNKRFGVK